MLTEDVEQKHVVEQVADAGMQEHGGKKPPILPFMDEDDIGASPFYEDAGGQGASGYNLGEQEYGYIDDDQYGCHRWHVFTRGGSSSLLTHFARYGPGAERFSAASLQFAHVAAAVQLQEAVPRLPSGFLSTSLFYNRMGGCAIMIYLNRL